jgi:acyl-CoA dehydrogenase
MIVPELPPDIRALKERAGRFVEEEVYPVEARIAERGALDPAEIKELRAKARAAGFYMPNMPVELGGQGLSMLGQVALEEESGKATNGLGFAVVDRGPKELLEIATPDQIERYIAPVVRGEMKEAWAVTEPGAGSDVSGIASTAVRDGDDWILNGETWFVTSEDEPGF